MDYSSLTVHLIQGLANFPAVKKGLEDLGATVKLVANSLAGVHQSEANPPDLLMALHYNEEIFRFMRNRKTPVAVWFPDKLLINESTVSREVFGENIFLFTFDPEDLRAFREFGIRNVHYLPLNSGLEHLGSLGPAKEQGKRFSCDVSFVGDSITVNHNPYFQFALNVSNLLKCLDEVAKEQSHRFTENILEPLYHEKQKDRFSIQYMYDYLYSLDKRNLDFVIGCEASSRMRKRLIALLDGWDVKVYGDDFWKVVEKGTIKTYPRIDYQTEMPGVFRNSKINLNLSRTFFAGTIQRVFDVLYCGGFLLTDHREDLEGLFQVGVEIETFRTDEEFIDKVRYYLAHDGERKKIARAGNESVRTRHRVTDRLKILLSTVFSGPPR
jgi:spore maturation protein CgeB